MAEEAKEIDAPPASEEEPKAPVGDGKPQRKRDETPIEELFDLSKPIPKAERPNKAEHDELVEGITASIDALKEERRVIQEQIDAAMESNKGSAIGKERDALAELRAKKNGLIQDKKDLRNQMDETRAVADRIAKDKKDARGGMRFSSIEEIDAEIAFLQRRQETTSMSLNEEKRLIKEMDALQASKQMIRDLKSKDDDMDTVKEKQRGISAQLADKDKEIDEVNREIDDKLAIIREISDKETDKRDNLRALFNRRDELRKEVNDKLKERDSARQIYREKNNAWYNYQRAVRAQKKMQYEEEKRRRDEERAAWLKKKEEEELKKIPYEEEMALCDYLADYLTRTYLTKDQDKSADAKKDDTVEVKDDPFAGFKPVQKKDEDTEYFGKGKGKKKRVRNRDKTVSGPFTLNLDTFEQFGLLNLNPPTSLDMVEKSVEDLKAKKKWYSEQPRGSVPTATEIRKANERAAAKLRTNGSDAASDSKQKKLGNADFSLTSDDFAPLGSGAAASSINAKWGQKTEEETAEVDESEEAAADEAP